MSDENIIIHAHIEGVVGGVSVVALEEDVRGFCLGFYEFRQREKRNPLPFHVVLAPGGYAMKVAYVLELGQSQKLVPLYRNRILHKAMDLQFPSLEWHLRLDAKVQNREVIHKSLAGWEPVSRSDLPLRLSGHFGRPPFLGGDVLFFHGQWPTAEKFSFHSPI